MLIGGIEAVIFDMDGTLVDSERYTERAIDALLRERGISQVDLDLTQFHGISWAEIARLLGQTYPELTGEPLATILHDKFHALFLETFPPLIHGAREAVRAAGRAFPTAIVTSSNRESVEHLVQHLDLRAFVRLAVCGEDCARCKPDPECYLLAADKLGCAPEKCLVFEDSLAGLRAAKSAGMWAVAIIHNKEGQALEAARELADDAIEDFTELAPDFFETVQKRAAP